MVDELTEWIAGTQRLSPQSVRIVGVDQRAGCFHLEVPRRNLLWYTLFAAVIWGIVLSIAIVFVIVADELWVQIAVPIGCVFVGLMLSIERKFEFCAASHTVRIKHRILWLNYFVWERSILFAFQMSIDAIEARDVEGLRQVEIAIFDGHRKMEVLLVFPGWKSVESAKLIAADLNSIVAL